MRGETVGFLCAVAIVCAFLAGLEVGTERSRRDGVPASPATVQDTRAPVRPALPPARAAVRTAAPDAVRPSGPEREAVAALAPMDRRTRGSEHPPAPPGAGPAASDDRPWRGSLDRRLSPGAARNQARAQQPNDAVLEPAEAHGARAVESLEELRSTLGAVRALEGFPVPPEHLIEISGLIEKYFDRFEVAWHSRPADPSVPPEVLEQNRRALLEAQAEAIVRSVLDPVQLGDFDRELALVRGGERPLLPEGLEDAFPSPPTRAPPEPSTPYSSGPSDGLESQPPSFQAPSANDPPQPDAVAPPPAPAAGQPTTPDQPS